MFRNFAVLFFSLFSLFVYGQHLYQLPKPLIEKTYLEKIIGPLLTENFKKPLNILWVYGYDEHHIPGAHDYVKVKDLMVSLLEKVPNITVDEAFLFPNQSQFDEADLVVMYLHLPQLADNQFVMFQNFIENGGGVVSLHETAIIRPSSMGKKLSKCLGSAWNEGTSKWGAIFDEIHVNNKHQVFRGFSNTITITDEFYWDLFQEESVLVHGTVRTGPGGNSTAPVAKDQLSEEKSPIFWTYELGDGRVFGTTTGHHTFTYFDPEFRIILFRAMAWAIDENPDPLMSLVFEGITNESGMVGTMDAMRYWEGKRRR